MRISHEPEPVTPAELEELRRRVASFGERAVAEELGCSAHTLARILASLPIRRGTAALVARYFDQIAA